MYEKGMIRNPDYATSIAAAQNVAEELSELQERVMLAFKVRGDQGFTDIELEEYCNETFGRRGQSTYRKRRTELFQKGLLVPMGKRRPPHSRSALTVWKLRG